MRVLIVEDDRDLAEMFGEVLRLIGHDPIITYGGHEALAALSTEVPDAILADLGLSDMSGVELIRAMRGMNPAILIVSMSGSCRAADIEAVFAAGADRHLAKPAKVSDIRSALVARP